MSRHSLRVDPDDDLGETVPVAGPPFSNAEELTESMVGAGTALGEGALFVSTNRTSAKLLNSCTRTVPDLDRSRLGAFTLYPSTHETRTVNTLSQVADARIDVRIPDDGDADGELRIRGLDDQPAGWQPFTLPSG